MLHREYIATARTAQTRILSFDFLPDSLDIQIRDWKSMHVEPHFIFSVLRNLQRSRGMISTRRSPPINPEVQHRRSAISVVRPVRLAGEVKASGRRGRSPQGGRSPTEGERPRRGEKSSPGRRPPGRRVVCPCPATPEHEPARLAAAQAQLSGTLRPCARTPTAPAGRPGLRLRGAGPPVNARLKTSAGVR